jgi:hypothetical protein
MFLRTDEAPTGARLAVISAGAPNRRESTGIRTSSADHSSRGRSSDSAEEAGKEREIRMILYHSTHKSLLDAIRKEGLHPHAIDNQVSPFNARQPAGVYMWYHKEFAMVWASKWADGIVLAVDVSMRYMERDPEFFEDESEAWVSFEPIPAHQIFFNQTIETSECKALRQRDSQNLKLSGKRLKNGSSHDSNSNSNRANK